MRQLVLLRSSQDQFQTVSDIISDRAIEKMSQRIQLSERNHFHC